ncbi:hypothetical protein [Oceanobacillus sp. CF4.6]|uniref:hypothetical protein n=1 Tax=Oceanobacillus sp. CF4.6 TaxID=3373080 RepID=UPI003EE5B95C
MSTAYSETKLTKMESFELVSKLHPVITDDNRKNTGFEFNKDADMSLCPAGHLATKKLIKKRSGTNRNTQSSSIILMWKYIKHVH